MNFVMDIACKKCLQQMVLKTTGRIRLKLLIRIRQDSSDPDMRGNGFVANTAHTALVKYK